MNNVPGLIAAYLERHVSAKLRASGPTGTLLHQDGVIRMAPDRDWMPFTAEQTMESSRTEFVWHARFKMAPLVTGVVEDAFVDGHGRLDAKVWGVFPVAHARGVEVDRGEAQRYLSELVWNPLAFLYNPDLRYESRGAGAVRVWVFHPDTYVDLFFDESGDVIGARTETRSRGDVVQPWEGRFTEYKDFGDLQAPGKGEVWWEAPEGDFTYWRGEVTSLSIRKGSP